MQLQGYNLGCRNNKTIHQVSTSRVDDNKRASDFINESNILKVIGCVKYIWREVKSDTIKHYGFPTDDNVAAAAQDNDEEFEMLFNEISELFY